jgi:hypothetical protein
VASIVTLKISSLHNLDNNLEYNLDCLPTKLQFKVDKNPTWARISSDVVSTAEWGLAAGPP